jgi:hypothetical protein
MDMTLGELWSTGGVILGFSVTAFSWRISREVYVGERDWVWLAPADYLNLAAMSVLAVGVFVLPILNVGRTPVQATVSLGLAIMLFVGYAIALAGHYELFSRGRHRSMKYFPRMEKVAVGVALGAAAVYIVAAMQMT